MTDKSFDPYHKWLGISPAEQPPNHYRLLGIDLFETDDDVIEAAANRQMAYVKQCGTGPHSAVSQKLLNELSTARITLLNASKKTAYDARLKKKQQPAIAPSAAPAPPIVIAEDPDQSAVAQSKRKSQKSNVLVIGVILVGVVGFGIFKMLQQPAAEPTPGDPIAATTPEQSNENPASRGRQPTDDSTATTNNEQSTQASGGRQPTDNSTSTNSALLNPDKPKPNTTVATKNPKPPANPKPPVATANEPPKPGSKPYLQFQGQSYVELANTAGLLDLNGSFTIEMWVKIPKASGKQVQFIAGDEVWPDMNPNVTVEGASGWVLRKRDGKLEFTMGVGGKNWYSPAGVLPDSDDWQYIRIEKTGVSVGGFANGATVFSSNARKRKFVPSPTNIFLGVRKFAAADRSSNVAIRAFRLTASTPYRGNHTVPKSFEKDADTAALLDFSKGTGTQLADLSGNGHHGTISGAQWKQESMGNSAVAQSTSQSVDLLKLIDPKRDTINGDFSLENGRLSWQLKIGSRLQIPGDQPDEYDLVVTSTRTSGNRGLMIGLPVGGQQVLAVFADELGSGLHLVDGKKLYENESFNNEQGLFQPGKESTVICSVRKLSVKITYDGKTLVDWKGDPTRLSMDARWTVPNKRALFIGGNAVHAISRLELRPVGSSGLGTSPTEVLASRTPIPDIADQKKAKTLIKDLFKDEYAAAKKPEQKLALAKTLLQQGLRTADDPVSKYVLLREARDLAADAGMAETALSAVEELVSQYQLDLWEAREKALSESASHARFPPQNKALVDVTINLVNEAVAEDRHELAVKLVNIAVGAARKTRDKNLSSQVFNLRSQVVNLRKQFETAMKAAETLKENPENPAANFTWGSYLCLTKNDWAAGLPLLAKSSDTKLKKVIELDLASPTEAEEQLKVADAWWDWIASSKKKKENQKFRLAAHYWYKKAIIGVSGLTKLKVEKRLKEIGEVDQPRSNVVIAGGIRTLHRWKLQSTLPTFSDEVRAVEFSPNGKLLAAASGNLVHLIDWKKSKPVGTLTGHAGRVRHIAFSPNGNIIATGSDDKSAKLWSVKSGSLLGSLETHEMGVVGVSISPDGKTLATAARFIRLAEIPSAKQKFMINLPTAGGGTFVRALKMAPDGQTVAAAVRAPMGGTTINLYPVNSETANFKLAGADVIAFSPNGRLLATGGGTTSTKINIYDPTTGAELFQLAGHDGATTCATFYPNSKVLATGGADNKIKLWDLNTKSELTTLEGHTAPVLSISFTPDGSFLASASADKTVKLWTLEAAKQTARTIPTLSTTPSKSTPNPKFDPASQRKVAEWVLGLGGRLRLSVNGKDVNIQGTTTLPSEPFYIKFIFLSQKNAVTDDELARLQACLGLEDLYLSKTSVTDAGLVYLAGLKQIKILDLSYTNVVGAGLVNLKGLTQLDRLHLGHTKVTDEDLKMISDLTSLRYIELSCKRITDAGLKHLNRLSKLEHLSLVYSQVTGSGFKDLIQLKSLRDLRLGRTPVNDAGLKYLKRLANIEGLSLFKTQVTDRGMKDVAQLKKLTSLNLGETKITDRGLAEIAKLQNIRDLHLHVVANVTDQGLVHLRGMNSLVTLSLMSTGISDAGLQNLVGLKNLLSLDLRKTKVTSNGAVKLQQELPKCRIIR